MVKVRIETTENNLDELILDGKKIEFDKEPFTWLWAHTLLQKKQIFELSRQLNQLGQAFNQLGQAFNQLEQKKTKIEKKSQKNQIKKI